MVKHKWRLAGLLIGNGWISPVDHYMSYLPFAYEEGLLQGGSEAAKRIESQVAVCTNKLSAGGDQHVDESDCEKILWDILDFTKKPDGKEFTCYNMYDVRLTDTYSDCGMNWPPDLVQMTPYLRKPEVKAALHVNSEKRSGWVECSGNVGDAFRARKSVPSIQMLPAILETVPIVLFSGAKDMICNHLGTEQLIHNMEWNGGKGFELNPGTWAPRRDWTFEGEPAGYYQEARNLTYVLFYNSSHMVPFDYPRRTRDMLDRFLKVDIASIGGAPAESRIDGEKGMETSVGGHPNSTIAEEEEKEKLEKAKWHAYYKSGEVALVIVIIAAGAWGWYVWRDRQRTSGYQGLFGGSNGHVRFGRPNGSLDGGMGLESFRHKAHGRDVEAAEFDESQLDELHVETPVHQKEDGEMEQDRYSIGGASSDEDASTERREGKRPDR
jgi:carboxypeptidase D